MPIDITNAMFEANILEDSVIAAYADYYWCKPVDNNIIKLKDGVYTNGLKVGYTARNKDQESKACILFFQGDNYEASNFKYTGKINGDNISNQNVPINIFWITNPSMAGAQGVRVEKQTAENYMFVGGPLSGCSCAFLRKDNNIYFIHSGAQNGSDENSMDTNTRRKTILRDLYNNLMYLDNEKLQQPTELLSIDDFVNLVNKKGFNGVVITASEHSFAYTKDNTKISVVEYSINRGKWDFFAFVNVAGNDVVGAREIDLMTHEVIRGTCLLPEKNL